jgi:hypothetical protein
VLHTTNPAFHTKDLPAVHKPSAEFLPLPPISNCTVMNRIAKHLALAAMLLVVLAGCRHKNPNNTLYSGENSVYFWRTWYSTNDYEDRFLNDNHIQTMYIRFFDVEPSPGWNEQDKCVPVATISFPRDETFGDFHIVPVVFITPEAIMEYESFTDHLAHRIYAMCKKNNITIDEVQFDCDWTTSTREAYFQFLVEVRKVLKTYFGKDIKVSSTIRLHQLAQTPPAVDYGVLMCYNTGDFKDFKTQNAILDIKDVQPYAKYLKQYKLPLKLALPDYSWDVEFDGNKSFVRLDRYNSFYDTAKMKKLGNGMYEITGEVPEEAVKYIRHEEVSAKTILDVKALVEKNYGKMPIVLYHLDSVQLSKYNDDEIKAFFD